MCWVALDRGCALAEQLAASERVAAWRSEAGRIRAAILTDGWSESAGAFGQSFGSDALDASALMVPIVGLLPASDRRVASTVDPIAERLTDERGFVYRYCGEDGLSSEEGTFTMCTIGWPSAVR